MIDNRKVSYNLPKRIIGVLGDIKSADNLLKEKDDQISINENLIAEIKGPASIILDFGKEISGGIRLLTHYIEKVDETYRIRLRFGESYSEANSELKDGATNDHSMRDFEATINPLSDNSFGETGFRFVRIDFLEDKVIKLKSVYSKEYMHCHTPIISYQNNDELIQQIYNTSVHTLDLCIQNYIWDGVKRDRLVWIGDMAIEVHSILNLYGNIPEIEKSINLIENSFDLNQYISGFASYSLWYLYVVNDVYSFTKDNDFLKRHKESMDKVLNLLILKIANDGNIVFDNNPTNLTYFIDWPSADYDEQEKNDANKNLMIYIFRLLIEDSYKGNEALNKALEILTKTPTKMPTKKQFLAFYHLVQKDQTSYELLIKDGAKGMSTFMSYFILKAISDVSYAKAIEIMKEYYGAMLDLGATTFFEDFEYNPNIKYGRIDEPNKEGEIDFHKTFGKHCYKGYRHSLCHGWSSGPISFLIENNQKS